MAARTLTVLVVDDEPALREVLSMRLDHWGYTVSTADSVEAAEHLLQDTSPDMIVSDVVMPGASGVDLVQRLRARGRVIPVILMTAHGSIDTAVEAMKSGAADFLTKPLDYTKLHALLETAAARLAEQREAQTLEAQLRSDQAESGIVGVSPPIEAVKRLVGVLAANDASALITGESGTGKEVVAQAIHRLSARAKRPFIAVNAAALPESLIESELFGHEKGAFTGADRARPGCFEQADGGTLFLDEIGEMPISLQPKLLRILEEGRARRLGGSQEVMFDVRVLAATNREPLEAVREGRLREDLFYRLNVFELNLPALRERLDDLPLLAQHFVGEFNRKHGTSVEGVGRDARQLLLGYGWAGNVRELRNVVERAVILAGDGLIEPSHLPPYLRDTGGSGEPTIVLPVGSTAAEAEKQLILRTLEHVNQNKAEAARQLGVDVKTIRNKLKSYREEAR